MNTASPIRLAHVASLLIRVVIYSVVGTLAVTPGVFEINLFLRCGMAAFAYSQAGFSLVRIVGLFVGEAPTESLMRGFRVMSVGQVIAGALAAIGGLWYGGFVGFVGAYGGFSFAWIWFWIGTQVAKSKIVAEKSTVP